MEEYKISLGAEISQQGLSNVKDQIKTLESNPIKLTLDKNLSNEIKAIKEQIDSLGSSKGKNKNALAINTESVEKSLNDIAVTIKEVRDALGTIDNKSGMKSLLSSINQITASLGKASDETQTLVSSLSALSKKDFSFNFGFNMGKSASQLSSEQGDLKRNAISQLKQQARALEDYFDQYYKVAQQGAGVAKLTQGTNVFRDYWELSPNIGDTKASLKQQVATYKQYIDLMQQAAKIKGVDLSGVVSGFSKTTDDIVKETKSATNSVEQFSQALKGLFSGGIDSESLTQILNDLNEINTAIKTLASDTSLGGLTQSFDNLSNTLKEITRDISTFAQAVNSGLAGSRDIGSGITNEVKGISNSFKNAGTESANEFESGFKKAFNLDDVISKEVKGLMKAEGISTRGKTGKQAEEEISTAFREYLTDGSEDGIRKVTDALLNNKRVVDDTKKVYQELDAAVRSINNGDVKVLLDKDIVSEYGDDFKEMQKLFGKGFVTRAGKNDVTMSFDEWFSGLPDTVTNALSDDYNRINAFGELFNQLQQQRSKAYMSTQEMISRGEFSFDEAESAIRSAVERVNTFEQASKQAVSSTVQGENEKQQAYEKTKQFINELEKEIAESEQEIKNLGKSLSDIEDYAKSNGFSDEDTRMAKMSVASAYEEELENLNRLVAKKEKLEAELSSLKNVTVSSGESGLGKISAEAGSLEEKLTKLKSSFKSVGFGSGSLDSITNDFKELGITVTDTTQKIDKNDNIVITVKGINEAKEAVTVIGKLNKETQDIDIDVKISDNIGKIKEKLKFNDSGFSDFDDEIRQVGSSFEKLSTQTTELKSDIQGLKTILSDIVAADEKGDIEALINANERYEEALKKVTNQIKKQQDAEKAANNSNSFKLDVIKAQQRLNGLFEKGSQAAKEFGDEAKALEKAIAACGDVKSLRNLNKEIGVLEGKIKQSGKSTKTLTTTLKEQFQSFGAYFSVHELFTYAYQGLQDMFEQIKLIDAAMTELKKVTNETDATYNKFLSNAADKAKKIGTTIDGFIDSTAEFAKIGYSFEDSQGLAEVANIYKVVGDNIDSAETATQSLISTMAAFKDEMNGMGNEDFAMSIVDKFNEVSNKYSIGSGGLGEALTRSASSMAAANNTLDETIALITAANEVVQNPEKIGKPLPIKKVAISVKSQGWSRPSKDLTNMLRMRRDCNTVYGNIYSFATLRRYSPNSHYNPKFL